MADEKVTETEQQFIERAGAEIPGTESPDLSRPHIPAKPNEEPAKATPDIPQLSEALSKATGSGEDDADSAGDTKEPKAKDDVDKDADSPAEGEEDEEPEVELTAEQKKANAEFAKALKDEGVDPSLDGIPEAARPLVAKKIKDLTAGFTRKMQALSHDRREAQAFKAEQRFQREHSADFIVSMLLERPEIAEAVNRRIEEIEGNATAVEGHKALVKQARDSARDAEEGEIKKANAHAEKIERYIMLGRAAARAAGVPFDAGVEDAMAARLALGEELSEDQIRQIAAAKAAVYQRTIRQTKRDQSGKYVKDKVSDQKHAGLRVKPGQGSAPAPGVRKIARNDQEFIDEFVARTG